MTAATLVTRWAADVDPDAPLPEHPRPQLRRDGWRSLNGRWDFALTDLTDAGPPSTWDGTIVVPFSPEAPLSGVGRSLGPGQVLWYRRTIPVAPFPDRARHVLLHLDAVDQCCEVWVGGRLVGRHTGGYLPATCDLSSALESASREAAGSAEVELLVRVTDDTDAGWHTRGKQRSSRGGIWYTPQSGIWQPVWLEHVPTGGVGRLVLTPVLTFADRAVETAAVEVLVEPIDDAAPPTANVVVGDGAAVSVPVGTPTRVAVPSPRLWSPADPHLYDVTVTLGADVVHSYAGLRSVGVGPDATGTPRIWLNGAPFFQAGVLDQGYWPDGLYTAPTDEALRADVVAAKELGFTMVRKHLKVEPMRWYHHCDTLGLLVWQDMPNGGRSYSWPVISLPAVTPLRLSDRRHRLFGRQDSAGRTEFRAELAELVEHLRSVPSVVAWVPFNEGWGQFDATAVAHDVRRLDPTRLVDHASGWHDQGGGDVRSLHVYFRRFRMPRRGSDPRPVVLSEYGGHNLGVAGHVWGAANFGYRKARTAAELLTRFTRLHRDQIEPAIRAGLCATVYTQLTDVEDELNGLLTYDRVDKLDRAVVRAVLSRLVVP